MKKIRWNSTFKKKISTNQEKTLNFIQIYLNFVRRVECRPFFCIFIKSFLINSKNYQKKNKKIFKFWMKIVLKINKITYFDEKILKYDISSKKKNYHSLHQIVSSNTHIFHIVSFPFSEFTVTHTHIIFNVFDRALKTYIHGKIFRFLFLT